jgi:hypothetical protein
MLPKRFVYPSPGFSEYWKEGVGKVMLEKLDSIPAREEIEQNAKLYYEYDLVGDRVIKEVFETMGFHKANALIDEALNNGFDSIKDPPSSIVELFAEADNIPIWLNQDLLKTGSEYCRRAGSFALVVLRNYCLMGGYESSAINKPLIYTEALKKGAAKRMAETVEFWVQVTGENAMQRDAIGFKSAIKVRLMHAYARAAIQKTSGWSNDLWGAPINQGDMVATNLGFSLVFIEGLKRVGLSPTNEEIKGVLHLWKYIGYLLGIPAGYLPDTETEAIDSLYKWTMTQSAADEDTKALAHALMLEPMTASFPKYVWQKKVMIKLHLAYNYYFLGDRACGIMALPATRLRYYPYVAAFMNGIFEIFNPHRFSVYVGRKSQERIKTLFLRSHGHNMHR